MTAYYLETVSALSELEPTMKKMEEEGEWRRIYREKEANMIAGRFDALFHAYRKK